MDGYRTLAAWQYASKLCLQTLEVTDETSQRRTWAALDQLRRAVISIDVNIVEGYALGTAPLFRRHLRIALGSAAEAQRLLEIAERRQYLTADELRPLKELADRAIRALYGLLRSRRLAIRPEPK